ncbi:MAG: hypothetical protein JO277_09935 [Candidatus Eremiobacteraeota bacterium]|nr:hypothetical protein [Candidatus Eremiobacteraeota bacterium]
MRLRGSGPHGEDNSTTISVRVPHELAQAIKAAAGNTNVGDWARALFRQATSFGSHLGAAFAAGVEHAEGWRAGWNAANQQFREALKRVLAEDPPEPPL